MCILILKKNISESSLLNNNNFNRSIKEKYQAAFFNYNGIPWLFLISPITKVLCALPIFLTEPRLCNTND